MTKGRPGFVFDQALLRHYLLITIVCRAEKFSAIHKGPEKRKGKCLQNSVPPPLGLRSSNFFKKDFKFYRDTCIMHSIT